MEDWFGPTIDDVLARHGLVVDQLTRSRLLVAVAEATIDAAEKLGRNARGDYSPDPKSERFPEWQPLSDLSAGRSASKSTASLVGLVDGWWREAQAAGRSESTRESYGKAVTSLAEFLGHDDASRVTPEDVIKFKDHLLAGERSPKTVNDSYLSGLKSVFGWAVTNRKISSNPAAGINIKVPKRRKLRDTWFSPEEIAAILSASAGVTQGLREPLQRYALKRWVPWLCAYTGARVGEIVQLRRRDVRQEGDQWIITITPEAGTVKDRERRDVPLHAHLVEHGFLDFVQAAPDGYLFIWSRADRGAWRYAKNHLTAFVRSVVTDPNVQPNHGWRHTFKTVGSEAGIQDKVLDAICGHDPRTVGESYGGVTLKAKARAMTDFPRYSIH